MKTIFASERRFCFSFRHSPAASSRFCFSFCHSLWESASSLVARTGDFAFEKRAFSPADKANQIIGALEPAEKLCLEVCQGFIPGTSAALSTRPSGPEVCLPPISPKSRPFSASCLALEGSPPRDSSQSSPFFRSLFIPRGTFRAFALLFALLATVISSQAQKPVWRQATDAELSALLPARAPVEKEHIETESSTASGVTDGKGHFIAGIVLITAGYSADGKYSHYLVVQSPISIDGIHLTPGDYVFGFSRDQEDSLSVRLYEALTGKPVGTAKATRMPGAGVVRSLRILPPGEKPLIQIGRFGIPYELLDK